MSKLKRLINKNPILDIAIKYGVDTIKFNLREELIINENKINLELQEQPSYFGFLRILQVKLERVKNDRKMELGKIESKLFIMFKGKTDPNTGRPYSNDLAEAKTKRHLEYLKANKKYNQSLEDLGIIESCVEAFSQRSFLLQTISANVRKERNS